MNKLVNDLMKSVHRACDMNDPQTARAILSIVETQLGQFRGGERGRVVRAIAGAVERIDAMQREAA